jgi:hypothetical protein
MRISSQYTNEELPSAEIERRVRAAQAWVDGVAAVADRVHDLEVDRLTNGVLRHIGVARPDRESYIEPVQGSLRPSILFIPLFPEDAVRSDTARLLIAPDASFGAVYRENRPGRIYMNAELRLSALLRGILILHEAKHAELYEAGVYRDDLNRDHWYEESAVFDFEFRLLRELSPAYGEAIAKLCAALSKQYDSLQTRIDALHSTNALEAMSLDDALGSSLSPEDTSIRWTIVRLDAICSMIAITHPDTAVDEKAKFLKRDYARNQAT